MSSQRARFARRIPVLLLLLGACSSKPAAIAADDQVSVAVSTQSAIEGSLADQVVAYGTAMPGIDATSTLSIQAEGRVTVLDVMVGSAIHRGQPLLTFQLAPTAIAAYQQAQTAWQLARSKRQHAARLLAQHLATRDQLAQADKTMRDARTALEALRQQQGSRSTIKLSAPFDGVVRSIDVRPGAMLAAGAALMTLASGEGMVVGVGIEANSQHPARVGDKVTLTPLGPGPVVQGVVRRVAGMLDTQTHLLHAEITPNGTVIPGMGYRADITVGSWHGWLIPRDAVSGSGQAAHVFQVANGKAVQVPVKVIGGSGQTSAVSGALVAGRPLVVVGNTQLSDGMAVRPIETGR